jgi:Ca-activated chloride channel family protein
MSCQRESAEERAPAPWSIEALAAEDPVGASSSGVSLCAADGQACSALRPHASFSASATVKTTRGARASLKLDAVTILDAIDESRVALTSGPGDARVVAIAEGNIVLRREGPGADEQPERPLGLRVAETTIEWKANAGVTAAIKAHGGGRADVTVRRGSLLLRPANGEPVELRAGETARLSPGERPDKRAGWAGGDAELLAAGEAAAPSVEPRGLGSITARVPGTNEVVSGVRLVSHKVQVVLRDGFARTEIEEEFRNDTPRVLEGRFVFPLPPDASISRLALWVGDALVEGEILERRRAASIFKGIVDDTVRPRDPALLEWVSGGEFSLKIFPIPAKGSRKVILAYNQALPTAGGRVRYVYPLSLGSDRASSIDDFSISVAAYDARGRLGDVTTPRYPASIRVDEGKLSVAYTANSFAPGADFVVSYGRDEADGGGVEASFYKPREGEFSAPPAPPARAAAGRAAETNTNTNTPRAAQEEPPAAGYVALRLTADLPEDAPLPARVRRDIAIVVDASQSQSVETFEGEAKLALGLLQDLDPDERFVILACDSACSAYPETGFEAPTGAALEAAGKWLTARTPGGSSDIAGALIEAAGRVTPDGAGQVVYIGDGAPSSGELRAESISARVKPALASRKVDLRLLGAGRSVDEVVLEGLAQAAGATYERVSTGDPLAARVASLSMGLRAPVVRAVAVDLPPSIRDVYPKSLPNLRLGQQLLLVGKATGEGTAPISIRGDLGGAPYSRSKTVVIDSKSSALSSQNPIVPRLWAEARIRELEVSGGDASALQAIALSQRFHVMSRHTALLVLENERMFAEFGVRRTTRKAGDQSDHAFSAPDEPSGSAGLEARGNLWGQDGLGLSGVGEGGGGRGEGIGLGSAGSLGHALEPGSGQGFGSGHSSSMSARGSHRADVPQVRMGATSVSGRLPPEVIQRIVRQNFGRFRLCYEGGLRANPNLAGRVAVRFIIGRDGAVSGVSNSGSDLPDASVVACVVRSFMGLSFPTPEGGVVTVTYPILFSPNGSATPASSWQRPPRFFSGGSGDASGPSAAHKREGEAWAQGGEAALDKLRKEVADAPESRRKLDALVRGLLSRGRFQEALTRAMRFTELDPDLASARELLAYAAAASGDGKLALTSVDGLLEASAARVPAHLRAARAFEAAGDERRACAHWRSAAELSPGREEVLYESLRCRARLLDGREAVSAEIKSMARRPPSIDKLAGLLDAGTLPPYEARGQAPSSFEARVTCSSLAERCPVVVVVAPNGVVYSPWTPAPSRGGSASSVSLTSLVDGSYRTLLVGGDPAATGEVEVRALGANTKTPLSGRGGRPVIATSVSGMSPVGFGWGGRRSFLF